MAFYFLFKHFFFSNNNIWFFSSTSSLYYSLLRVFLTKPHELFQIFSYVFMYFNKEKNWMLYIEQKKKRRKNYTDVLLLLVSFSSYKVKNRQYNLLSSRRTIVNMSYCFGFNMILIIKKITFNETTLRKKKYSWQNFHYTSRITWKENWKKMLYFYIIHLWWNMNRIQKFLSNQQILLFFLF